jgi:hypothetical protein
VLTDWLAEQPYKTNANNFYLKIIDDKNSRKTTDSMKIQFLI